jgi:aromatic amino acid aminotransferase II
VEHQQKFEGLITATARDRKVEPFYLFDISPDVAKHPNPIPLAGGTPNEGFFPVESIHLNLIDEPFQPFHRFDINIKDQVHQLNEDHADHAYGYATNPDEIAIARGVRSERKRGTIHEIFIF